MLPLDPVENVKELPEFRMNILANYIAVGLVPVHTICANNPIN